MKIPKLLPVELNPHGGIASRAEARRRNRQQVEAWARETIAKCSPELSSDAHALVVTEKTVADLVTALSARRTAIEMRRARTVLTNILRHGIEKYEWTVERFPDPIISLPRPPSPFRPESFARAALLSEMIRRHEQSLELSCDRAIQETETSQLVDKNGRASRRLPPFHDPAELLAARIVFSAIVDGGLLCRSLVRQLPEAMTVALAATETYLWIDFAMPTRNPGERTAYRRWFPDPVTACLMLRWRLQGYAWPAEPVGRIERLLERYLKHLGVSFTFTSDTAADKASEKVCLVTFAGTEDRFLDTRPRFRQTSPIEFLLDAAETRLRTLVPGVLVDFASSLNAGTSLPPSVWWRSILDQRLANEPEKNVAQNQIVDSGILEEVESWPDSTQWQPTLGRLSVQGALARELHQCFGKNKNYVRPAQALAALDRFEERARGEVGPLLHALSRWARWCLTARQVGKGNLRARSIKRYLISIGTRLIEQGGNLQPRHMSADEFLKLYDQVAGSIHSAKERTYARDRIVEFHQYLMASFDAPPLEWDRQVIERDKRSLPDANILSESEFKRIVQILESWVDDERLQEMLVLVTTVAFRLGLRRDEIAGLELASLQGASESGATPRTVRPQLWVHTTSLSSVKSTSSTRRLPLALLLQEEELERLFAWAARRHREEGTSDHPHALLFCDPGQAREKIGDKGVFKLITAALRFATGDLSLRFHHLRHSFVTLLIARLLGVFIGCAGESGLPRSWRATDTLEGGRLLKRLLRAEYPVRQAVYLVSALAGHLDPQETTQTYSHGLDWILGRYLAYDTRRVSLKVVATLEGRSYGAVAVHRQRRGATKRLVSMEDVRRTLCRLITEARGAEPQIFVSPPPVDPIGSSEYARNRPPPRDLMDLTLDEAYALALSSKRGLSQVARAQLFDLPAAVVSRFMSTAAKLANSPTATRHATGRRSRFLRHQKKPRRLPNTRQRPEVSGLGPALPRTFGERRESRQVFRALLDASRDKPTQVIELLKTYTQCVSRTDSELLVTSEPDAVNLRALLALLGIGAGRIRIHILAWPRTDDMVGEVQKRVSEIFGIGQNRIDVPNLLPQTRSRPDFGRLAVTVKEHDSIRRASSRRQHTPHAASGWKTACFYALVALQTASEDRAS